MLSCKEWSVWGVCDMPEQEGEEVKRTHCRDCRTKITELDRMYRGGRFTGLCMECERDYAFIYRLKRMNIDELTEKYKRQLKITNLYKKALQQHEDGI